MRHYERLAEQDRLSRRTIVDALEVLREFAGFQADDLAKIRIALLKLPSADVVGLFDLEFATPPQDKTYLVSLPSSARFHAARTGASRPDRFDIARLDRAVVDGMGKVVLADGTNLRAVEVIPAYLPLEPSELDRRIVRHTISMIGAEQRCYRRLGDGLPARFQDMVPGRRFLDCSKLSGLTIPPLKVIAGYIADHDPTLKLLSLQKIADALCKFGIRVPTLRPRIGFRRASAAI